ncbi:MAG: M12 family metallo-peptidase [Saprospiraceae bacterium]
MRLLISSLFLLLFGSLMAQSGSSLWTMKDRAWVESQGQELYVQPATGMYATLDLQEVRRQLPQGSNGTLLIPGPDGVETVYAVIWSPSAEAGYFERHPQTGTFRVQALHDRTIKGRIDYNEKGFHAFIHHHGRTLMIDPVFVDRDDVYAIYFKDEYYGDSSERPAFNCLLEEEPEINDPVEVQSAPPVSSLRSGTVVLKTYRIAISATGEYTNFHGGKAAASAEIVTAVNRLNAVLELEMGVHLNLIAANDLIVFTNPATDGFTNGETDIMINENPTVISQFIASSAYDIGHVFGVATNGQVGLAQLACVCTNSKARGVSGGFTPKFDGFYIDIVAHEVGHQFSASHSFNKCVNENPGTGWEPGSGSTIMSYAGSCGPNNVKNSSDDYYHGGSLGQMKNFIRVGAGAQCGEDIPTDNDPPVLTLDYTNGFSIPISTPFILEASAVDPDGDDLTYCWETIDTGPITDAGSPIMNSPLFRSFIATSDSSRVFPKMYKVAQDIYDKFELLPTYSRDMTFRVTVRDNNPQSGSIDQQDVAFKATELAGPFVVTSFSTVDTVRQGDYVPVTWDVANTDQYPVYCQAVSIYLSTDGGQTFPIQLAENVPNTGSFNVTIPAVTTNAGRIMVRAADNVFFNMSTENLRILPPTSPAFSLDITPYSQVACVPDLVTLQLESGSFLGFADEITLSIQDGLPPGAVATFSQSIVVPPATVQLQIDLSGVTQGGEYDLEIRAEANGMPTAVRPAKLRVFRSDYSSLDALDPPSGSSGVGSSPLLAWIEQEDAQTYTLELATSPAFGATTFLTETGLTEPSYQTQLTLDANTLYFWRVRPANICGSPDNVPVYAFHTISLNCTDLTDDTEYSITNQGLSSVESVIDIPNNGQVSEVRVQNISGTHQSIGDLRGFLESPKGTKVRLFAGKCSFIAGTINMGFNDESALPFNCPPSQGNIYASDEPLSAISGEDIAGEWKLILQDLAIGGGGKLSSWTLRLCTDVSLNNPFLVKKDTMNLLPGATKVLSSDLLLTEDQDNTPAELIYTLVQVPAHGLLRLNGILLTAGATFTQADIDQENLTYEDTSQAEGLDGFLFTVQDGQGGWFGIEQYPIRTTMTVSVDNLPPGEIGLEVFPNPTTGDLYLQIRDTDLQPTQIQIVNVLGMVVPVSVLTNGSNRLHVDLSRVPDGMYLVRVFLPEGQAVTKVQVHR